MMNKVIFISLLSVNLLMPILSQANELISPKLTGDNVLLVYKDGDELSKNIAEYYAEQRHVPSSQIVAVSIRGNSNSIKRNKFVQMKVQIAKHINKNIKVILLTWHTPFRVECMSITSALTLGFDKKYCSHPSKKVAKGCHNTANSPFYNAPPSTLMQVDALRLSMMLSGRTFEEAKAIIDRGVASDYSQPNGDAYLVRTKDKARSTRWPMFESLVEIWPERKGIKLHYIDDRHVKDKTSVKNKKNIMFYLTGHYRVPAIDSNTYLPGAIADHLTSYGGTGLADKGQMKLYRWLEAGVTGSYGTVVEPCNYPEKFPNAQVLIPNYLNGDTLIEAYWKSVQQPGEGIFVGEPLASPWRED